MKDSETVRECSNKLQELGKVVECLAGTRAEKA